MHAINENVGNEAGVGIIGFVEFHLVVVVGELTGIRTVDRNRIVDSVLGPKRCEL